MEKLSFDEGIEKRHFWCSEEFIQKGQSKEVWDKSYVSKLKCGAVTQLTVSRKTVLHEECKLLKEMHFPFQFAQSYTVLLFTWSPSQGLRDRKGSSNRSIQVKKIDFLKVRICSRVYGFWSCSNDAYNWKQTNVIWVRTKTRNKQVYFHSWD